MSSKSKQQAKTMTAACKSAEFRKKVDIPKKVACDFHNADKRKYHKEDIEMSKELDRIKSLAGVVSKKTVAEKVELNAAKQSGEKTAKDAKAGDVSQAMKMAQLKNSIEEREDDDTDFTGVFTGVAKGSITLDDKGKIAEASFGILKNLEENCGKNHKKKDKGTDEELEEGSDAAADAKSGRRASGGWSKAAKPAGKKAANSKTRKDAKRDLDKVDEAEQLDEFNPFGHITGREHDTPKKGRFDHLSQKQAEQLGYKLSKSGAKVPQDLYDKINGHDSNSVKEQIDNDQGYDEAVQWISGALKSGDYGPNDIGARPDEQLMSFDSLAGDIEAAGLMDEETAMNLISDLYSKMGQDAYDADQERGDQMGHYDRENNVDIEDGGIHRLYEKSAMFPKGSFERDVVEIIAEEMKTGKDAKAISEELAFSLNEVEVIYNILKKKLPEGYTVLPPMTDQEKERYTNREYEGLEGPFRLRSGKFVYYDKKAGKYYDIDSDLYMSVEDYFAHDKQPSLGEDNYPDNFTGTPYDAEPSEGEINQAIEYATDYGNDYLNSDPMAIAAISDLKNKHIDPEDRNGIMSDLTSDVSGTIMHSLDDGMLSDRDITNIATNLINRHLTK